jgi:hypothetical protein
MGAGGGALIAKSAAFAALQANPTHRVPANQLRAVIENSIALPSSPNLAGLSASISAVCTVNYYAPTETGRGKLTDYLQGFAAYF